MRIIIMLLLSFALNITQVFNQYFTIKDIEPGLGTYLKPSTINNLQWLGNSDWYAYSNDTCLFATNLKGDSIINFLGLKKLNYILSSKGDTVFKVFPPAIVLSEYRVGIKTKKSLIIFNRMNDEAVCFSYPDSAENISLNPATHCIAYTLGNNIYIQDSLSFAQQITFDSIDGFKNGDIVFRNEFGIEKGLSWSPKGNYLSYYKKNESFVTTYPLVKLATPLVKYKPIRYPLAGSKSEESDVWVYSLSTGTHIKIDITGDPEQYNTNISWLPDESALYIQHLNRDQDTMVLKSYSSASGRMVEVLFTETDEKYVEPQFPVVFSEVHYGNFFYQSERDGYNHIYYYDASKMELQQLTQGAWDVTKFIGADKDENYIYFMSNRDNPLDNLLYRLDIRTGTISRCTSEPGTHIVLPGYNMKLFFDEYSSMNNPRNINLIDNEGNIRKRMHAAKVPFNDIKLGEVITGTLLAGDDTTVLYYRLVKPVNLSRSKKYPVVIYLYGGPHLQLVTNDWMDRTAYFQQYLAQHDIASFVLDTRGSDNRGREFEDCIYRQSGIPQMQDQIKGIEFLKSLSFIDKNRIGIHGWSYGGYMTLSMMLNYPDIFKVGVAGGPVTSWSTYEVMYGERYMDRPEQNPQGYAKTDLVSKVDRLEGKLLIIHGGIDPVVLPQNSLTFIEQGIKKGKDIDFFIYPSHEHNVQGTDRVHLIKMITDYFIGNL
jgi:dipeptidyl-peptidase-4